MSRQQHEPVATDALLHLAADQLIVGLRDQSLDPVLVHLALGDRGGFDLGVKPLAGRHPTELLLGFTAPSAWHAVGMATAGWAYRIEQRGNPARAHARVHVVTMVSRSGEVVQRTHVSDDSDLTAALSTQLGEPEGEQIDLLRRVLDLPTAPPPCDAGVFWAIEWLAAVLGADTDGLTTWDDVVAHHPAVALLRAAPPGTDRGPGEDFVDLVESFARVCDWSRIRELVRDDRLPVPDLVASDAEWLDDGAFARFVLNRCPPALGAPDRDRRARARPPGRTAARRARRPRSARRRVA